MAGPNIGTAWVTLAVTSKGIGRQVENELKPAGDAAKRAGEDASSSLEKASTKALAFATVGAAGLFGLASAAGDLEAAIAANEQVLGDASTAVQEFARNGVENVGLSETAVLNAGTAFGQLGKIMGLTGDDLSTFSTDMVTLAADLAAFANVPASQAVDDLRSAFAGSTETMQKYNVFLNETELKAALFRATGEQVTGTLTAQQRVLATHAALMAQTGDIQGQAAREAGSFQRQMDNLKATVSNVAADFGAPIVGFAASLLEKIGGGIQTLSDWNEQTGGMLATGTAAGLGIAAAAAATIGVAGKVKGAVDAFRNLSRGMQLATGIAGGLAIAVTAGFAIYGLMTQRSREVAARTREVGAALQEATAEAIDYQFALDGSLSAADGLAAAQHALSIALTTSGEDGDKLVQTLGALGIQSNDAFTTLFDVATRGRDALTAIAADQGFSELGASVLAFAASVEEGGLRSQTVLDAIAEALGVNREAAALWVAQNEDVIGNLRDLNAAASAQELDDLAEQFLNTAVASSEEAEALVVAARARAEQNDVADSSVDTYNELLAMIGELPPAEQEAALEALGLADANEDVTSSVREQRRVAADQIDTLTAQANAFEDLEDAASAFRTALDRLVGNYGDVQEASDELAQGFDDIRARIAENIEEGDEYLNVLLDGSEAARENRAAVLDQRDGIVDLLGALAENGATVQEMNIQYAAHRDQLIAVMQQLGLTREEAESYTRSLGLTPDLVQTTVDLVNEERARVALEEYISTVEDVPAERVTEIEALIDQGAYQYAESLIRNLTAPRQAFITPVYTTPSGRRFSANAYGGYYEGNTPTWGLIGEAPWDEAVLTVGNMGNLRKQLTDPRIREPIVDALDFEPVLVGVGGGSGGSYTVNNYDRPLTSADLARGVRMARMTAS